MRILYVCDALAIYGGLERVLIDKANWFVQYGDCEVCLLTVNQGDHPITKCDERECIFFLLHCLR